MRRISTPIGTVSGAVAAVLGLAVLVGVARAQADSFSMRWAAFAIPPKGDRLAVAVAVAASVGDPHARRSFTLVRDDPSSRITIARKPVRPPPDAHPPLRAIPDDSGRGRNPILDGCDPAFSPVTTPDRANVAGRCLASLQPLQRVAVGR